MQPKILLLAGLALALPAFASATQTAQTGSYTYTHAIGSGAVVTRDIKAKVFERVSVHVEQKYERIVARQEANLALHPNTACARAYANSAALSQAGSDNRAAILQTGNHDSTSVAQAGTSNAAYVAQFGNNQALSATQAGDHNLALLIQRCHH